MAHGTRLQFEFNSFDGHAIKVLVKKEDYTGTIKTVTYAGSDPVVIYYNGNDQAKEHPIVASNCEVSFNADSSYEYQEFFHITDRQYIIEIYKNGYLYWAGWVIANNYSEDYASKAYVMTLKATDGLGDLSNIPLSGFSTSGRDSLYFLLNACIETLNPLGLTLQSNLNWHPNATSSSDGAFFQRYTLTGTGGTANFNVDGTDYLATFSTDLTTTASNFVSTHATNILATHLVHVGSSGDDVFFTKSSTFTTSITNASGDLDGTAQDHTTVTPMVRINIDAEAFSDSDWTIWDCDQTVSGILKFMGARLFQASGYWYVQKIDTLDDWSDYIEGGSTGVPTRENPVKILARSGGDIMPDAPGGNVVIEPGYDTITLTYNAEHNNNIIRPKTFDSSDFSTGVLTYWDTGDTGKTHSYFTNWDTSAISYAEVTQLGETGVRLSNPNTEYWSVLSFGDDGGGDLRVTVDGGSHTLSVNDVIEITGSDNYEGFHTITNVSGAAFDISGLAYTSDDSDDDTEVFHWFNSHYISKEIDPGHFSSVIQEADGHTLKIEITYKVETTDTEDTEKSAILPLMLVADQTIDQYVNIEGELVAGDTNFYKLETSVVNKWVSETIEIQLEETSLDIGGATLAIGIAEVMAYKYTNTTGVIIRDLAAYIDAQNEIDKLTTAVSVNSNMDSKLDKTVEHTIVDDSINFDSAFIENNEFVFKRLVTVSNNLTGQAWNDEKENLFPNKDHDELYIRFLKNLYSHNSLRISLDCYGDIEFNNSIKDLQSMGKLFMLTKLQKSLKNDTFNFTGLELKPRFDAFRKIDITPITSFEPADHIGPPSAIDGFINLMQAYRTDNEALFWEGTTQSGTNEKVALSFDGNNIPYIQVDNSDDHIYSADTPHWSLGQPFTIMLAVQIDETVVGDTALCDSADQGTNRAAIILNNDTYYINGGTQVSTTGTADKTKIEIITAEFNGASSKFWIDKTQHGGTLSAGTDRLEGMNILGSTEENVITHKFYGGYAINGTLTTDELESAVDMLRAKTQADRIGIVSATIENTSRDTIDIVFDRSVTSFDTDGLTLEFTSGSAKTINAGSQSGSGTSWSITIDADATNADVINLIINNANGATTTDGDYLYPGTYPITNLVNDAFEYADVSSYLYEYTADDVTKTGSDIDSFDEVTGSGEDLTPLGATKVQQATDSDGITYIPMSAVAEGYQKTFGAAVSNGYTRVIGLSYTNLIGQPTAKFSGDAASNESRVSAVSSNLRIKAGGTNQTGTTTLSNNIKYVLIIEFNGATSNAYIDNVLDAGLSGVNPGSDDLDGLTFFENNSNANGIQGRWYKEIIFDGILSTADRTSVFLKMQEDIDA